MFNRRWNGMSMCKRSVLEIRNRKFNINDVHEAAEMILSYKEYNDESAIPIVKIVKDAGFSIYTQKLSKNIGGCIMLGDKCLDTFGNDKVIILNRLNSPVRMRFSLAHEFGHYLLDPNAKNVIEYYNASENDNDSSDIEKLVNRFAAELLMPKDKFLNTYNQIKKQFTNKYDMSSELSKIFGVPINSINKRFSELGLGHE